MSFTRSYAIPAKASPVYDALTSPLHLGVWLAEHVEVGGAPGDPFHFWGRHTLWVPEAAQASQTLTRVEFPSALGFDWRWNGVPGRVAIEVSADGEGSRVDVEHQLDGAWPAGLPGLGEARAAEPERIVGAFWDVAMHNLAFYLYNGEALLLPGDHVDEDDPQSLCIALPIEAPVEAVYRALVEPARLDTWIAAKAEVEEKAEGAYRFGWGRAEEPRGPSRVLALRPAELLEHDWSWPGEKPSRVVWELSGDDEETELVLRHLELEAPDPVQDLFWCQALLALRAAVSEPAA